MLYIDKNGYDAARIKKNIIHNIERKPMDSVNGIVIHQTGGPTKESTFSSYKEKGANGAHFLIDEYGTIFQTASLKRVTNHVGRLRSRCFITMKCEATELKHVRQLEKIKPAGEMAKKVHGHEIKKSFPDRYPSNADSIGIEIVGIADKNNRTKDNEPIFQQVNEAQNSSLKWLIDELASTLKVPIQEIYRHPAIARKNPTEASSAQW
jgi:N-acetyl-anhydromuramyl-L-alanine amidase AmpD